MYLIKPVLAGHLATFGGPQADQVPLYKIYRLGIVYKTIIIQHISCLNCGSFLASSSNSSCSVTNLVPGLLVIARWRDRKWYAAKLVKRVGKKICVDYLDNDRDNVAAQHILPLVSVYTCNWFV